MNVHIVLTSGESLCILKPVSAVMRGSNFVHPDPVKQIAQNPNDCLLFLEAYLFDRQ